MGKNQATAREPAAGSRDADQGPCRPRRLAVVSKATAPGGGASRMAEELAALLRAGGFAVDHWAGFYSGAPRQGLRQLHGPRAVRTCVRLLHKASGRLGLPELPPAELAVFGPRLGRYDLVHFHDLPGATSPLTVAVAMRVRPCVVTLHDCSFFTGGCIQPLDCPRFGQGCGDCPQRGTWPVSPGPDRTALLARIKGRIIARGTASGRLFLTAPSRWMAGMAAAAGVAAQVAVIPNGVDCRIFAPRDRGAARLALGLPPDRPVVLLLTGSLGDRFKGVGLAAQALRALPPPRPAVLAIGIPDPGLHDLFAGLDVRFTGYLADRRELASRIAAADALLYPSLADNLPLTVLESMACGLPAVSFATGGIPEIIAHGANGFLAPPRDVAALTEGLRAVLSPGRSEAWGRAARETVERNFSHERMAAGYAALYARILGGTA